MRDTLTTIAEPGDTVRRMIDEPVQIYKNRQPRRPHFIQQWAEKRGLRPVDLATEINVDKSVVSRWYQGSTPGVEHQQRLAVLFGVEPESIFRHPDDDWISRFLSGRRQEEIDRIKAMLEVAFPKKVG